ncbi:Uncharacterised protein [Mycobacterium tuberculosis]|uniref:Secreted protein n=1 Tax=Mycobacterium tuberculosis TaxID=1773 RepID=A0A0U0TFN7_MYCTX|nr:Uncharacterised protein [Mycobacterium tuberculosis]COX52868.1 Uncharacterised protein [Mycobacterium tuberculosis]COY50973.1 Uncharacterised protein [Mycobacterium tuberculosis]
MRCVPVSVVATCAAFAAASTHTTSLGTASGPSAAMTTSSSTCEAMTSGSMPASRRTLSRPGEADPSTSRVIGACASFLAV